MRLSRFNESKTKSPNSEQSGKTMSEVQRSQNVVLRRSVEPECALARLIANL